MPRANLRPELVGRIDGRIHVTPEPLLRLGQRIDNGLEPDIPDDEQLHERGFRTKSLAVGSTGDLTAARRGECDVAGIHLLDPATDTYNVPFLDAGLVLVRGYARLQGLLFHREDARFAGRSWQEAVQAALADPSCRMVNRNRGSGTRVLIDRLLGETRPAGFYVEVKSHNAVAAAVAQGRADWGLAIETVARDAGLGFIPLREEQFDFAAPTARLGRPAVREFTRLLQEPATRALLGRHGFRFSGGSGEPPV